MSERRFRSMFDHASRQSVAKNNYIKSLKRRSMEMAEGLGREKKKRELEVKAKIEKESKKEAEEQMMREQEDLLEADARKFAQKQTAQYAHRLSPDQRQRLMKKMENEYFDQSYEIIFGKPYGKTITERNKFNYYIKVRGKQLFFVESDLNRRASVLYGKKMDERKLPFETKDIVVKGNIFDRASSEPQRKRTRADDAIPMPRGWKPEVLPGLDDEDED
jgi:hypothetical protein